jgi:hypothetical protein
LIHAQAHEIGIWGGGANYFGDLNPKFNWTFIKPAGGLFYRYNLSTRFATKLMVSYGEVEFKDSGTKIERNLERNLSFKSSVADVTGTFEFNFFKFDKTQKKFWFSPYLATGLGIFFFNPQAEYNGRWYFLQPLGTEGQNDASYTGLKKYKLWAMHIPIEGGFKFHAYKNLNFSIFASVHKTFTDYLDDVSGNYPNTVSLPSGSKGIAYKLSDRSDEVLGERIGKPGYARGESKKFDDFVFVGVSISYTFMYMTCPWPTVKSAYR